MNEKRKHFKIIGCVLLLIGIPLAGYIGLHLCWWLAWHPSEKERVRMETEATDDAIQHARDTGYLQLYRPWFFGSEEFYKRTMFEKIHGLSGVKYLYCNGYLRVFIPAQSVANVASMPDLEEIVFHNVYFEKGALLEMRDMAKLKSLYFWGCEVDGDDLKCLADLEELRVLKIHWPFPNAKANDYYKVI